MISELELILMMVSYVDIMLFERGVLSLVFIVWILLTRFIIFGGGLLCIWYRFAVWLLLFFWLSVWLLLLFFWFAVWLLLLIAWGWSTSVRVGAEAVMRALICLNLVRSSSLFVGAFSIRLTSFRMSSTVTSNMAFNSLALCSASKSLFK